LVAGFIVQMPLAIVFFAVALAIRKNMTGLLRQF
jgi:hypothetical protein